MVNITNDEIKLLNKMLDEYGKSISVEKSYLDRKSFFKYQDIICRLNWGVEKKKENNKEQYQDRLFWKNYNKIAGEKSNG